MTSEIPFSINDEINRNEVLIDDELDLTIKNVSVLFETGCTLDLKKIASSFTNVKIVRSAAVKQMRSPKATVLFRSTGKITIVGADCKKKAAAASKIVVKKLRKLGYSAHINNFHVVNLLANCLLPWKVRLEPFTKKYKDCVRFHPEIFNFCHVKFLDINAHIDVYYTGILRLIAKREDDLVSSLTRIYSMTSMFAM